MKLKPEQIKAHVGKGLATVYFVNGDEPLQSAEVCDTIRAKAREQGYDDRLVLHVEAGFDWGELYQAANALSLFAQRRIIELRLKNYTLKDTGSKALQDYLQAAPEGNVLIITGPKLDAKAKRAKWYKQIDKAAVEIPVWPIEANQLPGWIAHRVKSRGMTITPEAAKMLAERVEGNMLAAAQDIEKLALLHPDQTWDAELVMESVADSAKYDIFGLVDSALLGDSERFAHILEHLRASGEEPVLVLWALGEELRKMYRITNQRAGGQPMDQVLKQNYVWAKRQKAVRSAAERLKPLHWLRLLRSAGRLDRIIKGQETGNCWDELLKLGLAITGKHILRVQA